MSRRTSEIIDEMHKIVCPGEYGLGTEKASVPHDDKKAWERMGELIDEMEAKVAETRKGGEGMKRSCTEWAIMSRTNGNVEDHTLKPLRREAWAEFFESIGVTTKKKKAWYRRHWKAVRVNMTWNG